MSQAITFKAEGIVKRFGRRRVALDRLDLELAPGQVTVLLGRNGAGKSTLMRLALGVLKPQAGRMTVMGLDPLRERRRVQQQIGFVPSVPDAYGWMTLAEFLRFLRPQYPTWSQAHADALIEQLEVPARTRFKDLSRGEGMKAMLVAALAPKPPLLLLDEPFAGLDPIARAQVLRSVIGAIRADGREQTVLCSTHDLDVASRIAERVAILAHGKIVEHGALEEVLGDPANVPQRIHEVLETVGV